ncbi:MAG: 4Fe-4S dicluster domain-containing protein [Candidatus Anammoxibacter sp.]
MIRIGVFICHCGENISRTVNTEEVAKAASKWPGVAYSTDYKYMCSDPGQSMLKKAIKDNDLTGIVVAACTPKMHEQTFRRASTEAGINPYLCEISNIREHCSWVHEEKPVATNKAINLVRMMVEKVKKNSPLETVNVSLVKRALVIGAGIAGIQAALDIANAGYEVILVERGSSIGGHMAQLSETFPTMDCSQCILTPRMVEVAQHDKIKLYTYSEVVDVSGYIGNFKVEILKKPRSVNLDTCTGCGECMQVCPSKKIKSEFDMSLGYRTAVYTAFTQAVPNNPIIDRGNCIKFKDARKKNIPVAESMACGKCFDACPIEPVKAINFSQKEEMITEEIGAIIVATGYQVQEVNIYGEYGAGKYQDVITGLHFERLASASGPTEGKILRPSDKKVPKTIVFIHCVGSRDPQKGIEYCSKICCMYTAKHAMLYKHKVHDGNAIVFYIDIRCAGKNYDEFSRRVMEEEGVIYLRGRVSRIYKSGDKLMVKGADTLTNTQVVVEADMVVLATAVQPQPDIAEINKTLHLSQDKYGFFTEAHPKLRPVETASSGIFLAGACVGPVDIPETVTQASGAACKVLVLFAQEKIERSPTVAKVNRSLPPVYSTCIGCFNCEKVCPYNAIEREEIKTRSGELIKVLAKVNEILCQGCGLCTTVCRPKAVELAGFTDQEIFAEINAL